jgi:L-threonylcarbamoyladenylate synthase
VTRVVRVDPANPDPDAIAEAAICLRAGGLVAFPTETVYGLGALALDHAAVRRLFTAKGRPATDPLIVHVPSIDRLPQLVQEVSNEARALAARFWPGPLTLVLPRSSLVPREVTAGLDTVAVRVPAHPVARALLIAVGAPVAAPSANLFSRPSPTTAAHVMEDLDGLVDIVLDSGATTVGLESTVVDLSRTPPTVLRPGAITLEMLRSILPGATRASSSAGLDSPMASPGLLPRHYSPRSPLTLYEGSPPSVLAALVHDARAVLADGRTIGILAADEDRASVEQLVSPSGGVVRCYLGPADDLGIVVPRFYAALRALDAAGVDRILARGFPVETGLGIALQDRLRRAAAGDVVMCESTA